MNKVLFCLLAVLALTSCEEKEPVYIYEDSGVAKTWRNVRLKVNAGDWVLYGTPNDYGSYYYYDFKVNELTQDIFKEGLVLMYIESDPGNANIKQVMPFTVYNVEKINGQDYYWTVNYDFDFEPGYVRVYCKISDFMTNAQSPGTEVFHLVLVN